MATRIASSFLGMVVTGLWLAGCAHAPTSPSVQATPGPGYAPPTPEYGVGSARPEADPLVRSIQRELIRLGYLRGSADGYMGPRTSSAIRSFEQVYGLPVSTAASPHLLARLQATPTHVGVAAASSGSVSPSTSP